jgi:alkylhydroperoxidase family enzyme
VASCHFGDDGVLVSSVVANPERAPVSPKMKALLAIAARVRGSGRDVRESDVARARTEGATDTEIHDTVLIAAAFCMFNRYVDGLGARTPTDAAGYRERARFVAEHGYAAILPQLLPR